MATKILRKLRRVAEEQIPIRIERGKLKKGTDVIRGLVSVIGPDWLIVTVMWDGIHFDGWEVLRTRDVTDVSGESASFNTFFARAIQSLGTGPVVPTLLSQAVLSPDKEALSLVLQSTAMCALHLEESWPDELYVGRFEGTWREKKHGVRQIGVSGRWSDETTLYAAKKITRISVGSRYINGLEAFGDPFPTEAPSE